MLTQTSEIAIRLMVYMELRKDDDPTSPRQMASDLDASPSYLAKITRDLVKAGILRSHRGAMGGVTMARNAKTVTLLEIIQAVQGLVVGSYCQTISDHPDPVCAFHEAMKEVHVSTLKILTKWTLADLAARPGPSPLAKDKSECKMGFCQEPCDAKGGAKKAGAAKAAPPKGKAKSKSR